VQPAGSGQAPILSNHNTRPASVTIPTTSTTQRQLHSGSFARRSGWKHSFSCRRIQMFEPWPSIKPFIFHCTRSHHNRLLSNPQQSSLILRLLLG
jgi:hypothetical protein